MIVHRWRNLALPPGHPDPWVRTVEYGGGIVALADHLDTTWIVGTMTVPAVDVPALIDALRAAPRAGDRYDPKGERRRLAAGRAAMRIRDAMIRARVLDAVDGWSALLSEEHLVDADPRHGRLYDPPPRLSLTCRLLRVVCPSTGRAYVLCVPRTHYTAADARRWVLGLSPRSPWPEDET